VNEGVVVRIADEVTVKGMPLRVSLSPRKIQSLYEMLSPFYDAITRYEKSSREKALEIANVRDDSVVLEVGFGTGKALAEIVKRTRSQGEVFGLDISQKMTKIARKVTQHDRPCGRLHLLLADAKNVPFQTKAFDVVFASYLLDLIDTPMIPRTLLEFRRILRPSGRLVLVSLSEGSNWCDNMRLYKRLYGYLPILFGGCRPVQLSPYLLELGFKDITRQHMHTGHIMPTEIVSASKQ
jgi:ubiquinone/menaquinone biosynthesis C-methylase UbiE